MPRPHKCRKIHFTPEYTLFKPAGIPSRHLEEIQLTLDELEALRLADLEGIYQEEAAKLMEVSRQTFGNIIETARRKVIQCLIEGKALKIEGGTVNIPEERTFKCLGCQKIWTLPFGTGRPTECPFCRNTQFHREN